jgi:hypothetical protein
MKPESGAPEKEIGSSGEGLHALEPRIFAGSCDFLRDIAPWQVQALREVVKPVNRTLRSRDPISHSSDL